MPQKIINSTPKKDGYFMPAEFSPQSQVFMIFPERCDNWRNNAYPAQAAYADVAKAISKFTPVTVFASNAQYKKCRALMPPCIRVIEMTCDDAWIRDTGATYLVNNSRNLRAVSWNFNAWGGTYDGLYSDWDNDNLVAEKMCNITNTDYYTTPNFVLEGGSIHTDGNGTVLTTKMCLLSPGRNPHMSQKEIESTLKEYLGAEKILWITDGIDPDETNGHIDDVACFVREGEVCCIYTDDKNNPFYTASQNAYKELCNMTDAHGRRLKVHKVCCTKNPVLMSGAETIRSENGSKARNNGDMCIASYVNFLITNNGVIVPQYDDENDLTALEQIQNVFPDKEVVGVKTREIVYGGGNIHCITQQLPVYV